MARAINESIADIFKSVGQPTVTYVRRDNAKYEKELTGALRTGGQVCLITGPSKTGKTTLYRKVLGELGKSPLVVRCDRSLGPLDFWATALESIDFSRLRELQKAGQLELKGGGKISGTLGWRWLAGLMGEVAIETTSNVSDTEIKERILANPSAFHLVPLLKKLPIIFVVEDYHYLSEETQQIIFQQWKSFVDEEVSVIILGTSHRAIDIMKANNELLGRICHIEISRWEDSDLKKIVTQGFDFLEVPLKENVKDVIARESVGLPIVTQQACQQLFGDKNIFEHTREMPLEFKKNDVEQALKNVAATRYATLANHYNRLVAGPRKRARKYDTYEYILACFAQQPIKFSLQRHEIDERIAQIKIPGNRPPTGSINSTLSALGKFQARLKLELLEWRPEDNVLYMLEPLFLFYLRWREGAKSPPHGSHLIQILEQTLSDSILNVLFKATASSILGNTTNGGPKAPPKSKDEQI